MTVADRVKDTTQTAGTGLITLAQSVQAGFQLFGTAFSVASTVTYCISSRTTADWEVGNGTFTPPNTLTRTPTSSSNAGALVNFGAEIKDVFVTQSASDIAKLARSTDAVTTAVIDATTSHILIEEGGVTKRIAMSDFLAALGTSSGGLPAAAALAGTNIITVSQDGGTSQVKTTLATLATFLGAAPAAPTETITVNTPASQAAGTAFALSGTYANGTPAALDYSLDGGSTWVAAATPTIAGGNYSFSLTISTANASQVVKVRDHTNTTIIATSAAFAVAAGSAPTYVFSFGNQASIASGGNITNNGYYAGPAQFYIKRASNGVAANAVRFVWNKILGTAPLPDNGTRRADASADTVGSRVSWDGTTPVGTGYYGLYNNGAPYIYGTAGTYYLWAITDDGFADVVRNTDNTPYALVLT